MDGNWFLLNDIKKYGLYFRNTIIITISKIIIRIYFLLSQSAFN